LHRTHVVTSGFHVLATENLIPCERAAAGRRFAHHLATLLQEKVDVTPVADHGDRTIGRDCHHIGDRREIICQLLLQELTDEY